MNERKSAEEAEITGFKYDFDILKHQEVIDRTQDKIRGLISLKTKESDLLIE